MTTLKIGRLKIPFWMITQRILDCFTILFKQRTILRKMLKLFLVSLLSSMVRRIAKRCLLSGLIVMVMFFVGVSLNSQFNPVLAQDKPEEFIVVPLKVNVLKGSGYTKEDKEEIKKWVEEANAIFEQAKIRLEFDMNNNINEIDDKEQGDPDGTVGKTLIGGQKIDQIEKGRTKGVEEIDKKFGKGQGVKVIITKGFREYPGYGGLSAHCNNPVAHLNPGVLRKDEMGKAMAHELGHIFSLGSGHMIDSKANPPKKADGEGHSIYGGDNLMAPNIGSVGENLTPDQIKECKKGAKKREKKTKERTVEPQKIIITPADTKHGSWTDDLNDVIKNHVDLSMGFLFAEGPTADLDVSININGLHPIGTNISSKFQMFFNTDNNIGTGSTFGSFIGIDKILTIILTGQFPFKAPTGSVSAALFNVTSGTLTSLTAGTVNRVKEVYDFVLLPDVPMAVDVLDSINQSLPLPLLGQLADYVPIGIRATDLDTGEFDEVSFTFEFNTPPGPSLEMEPLLARTWDTINLIGKNFLPLSTVTILIGDTKTKDITTLGDGTFSNTFNVPELPSDDYFITARGESGFDFSILKIENCGNSILDLGEQCDDGNLVSGDGCSPTCQFEPDISVSPSSLSFGTVIAGGSSTNKTVTVSNTGAGSLTIGAITITGTNPDQFSITTDNCSGQLIVPSSSCTVDVKFSPTSLGKKTATLNIPSDDPDENTKSVSLSGTGAKVVVTSPNGGEIWESGIGHIITWQISGTIGHVAAVKLFYTMNGGTTWKLITTVSPSTVSYTWYIPRVTVTKKKCKVKVVLKDAAYNIIGSDKSDAFFKITPYTP